ncbi:MAG: hypothetical protein R3246_14350, partial [Acidimicrobiia bacterium]|nr:hypothetical protein [Acidimicrobiia bacterium]
MQIIDAGISLPDHRVANRRGSVAVATWDQDAITLGSHAALDVLDRNPDVAPTAIYFASTTAPYAEGSNVGLIAEILGLADRGVAGYELGGSTAAGASALSLAMDRAGRRAVLVIAAEAGRSDGVRRFGDGAVALLLGRGGGAGSIDRAGHDLSWFMDRWRLDGADAVTQSDRSLRAVSPGKAFGAQRDVHVDDANPQLPRAGHLGSAAFLASMLLAFEGKRKGTTVTASASAGGVSFAFTVAADSATKQLAARVRAALDGGVDASPGRAPDLTGFDPYTSESRRWRERAADLRLEASVDSDGTLRYPPHGDGARVGLSRTGTVYTQTKDHVYPLGGPQSMAVVSLDGGGRFYGQVIDEG